MASIKIKFRPSAVAGHEGSIVFQIIHKRKVRQLPTDYHLYPCEWDDRRSRIAAGCSGDRRSHLLSLRERIHRDAERLFRIDRSLDNEGLPYSADDIVCEFRRFSDEYSLFNFMSAIISNFRLNDKIRTSETYRATLSSFRKFRNDQDLRLDCLTSEIMESYEAWLRRRGLTLNTISFYNRILRAVYNRAVRKEVIENRNPFRNVYTGIDKTVKRALPLTAIRKIRNLDLSPTPDLEYARDMFMMSFYCRGMSFVDMAYLKKSDLQNGVVTYRRRKTGQQLRIKWTKEMQSTIDKYPRNESGYLLPIIRSSNINARHAYRNKAYNINRSLKKIAERAGISINLTLYVARHSWASAAKAKGIPLSVISEGMGHDSETTTRIYLASLDTNVVDRANSLILSSL